MYKFCYICMLTLGCAGSGSYVSVDDLLQKAQSQPAAEACSDLSEAMRSGRYGTTHWTTVDSESRTNSEWKLARAKEHYCHVAESTPASQATESDISRPNGATSETSPR